MIHTFMATLVRDINIMTNNSTSHEASLEEILYIMII